MGAPAQQSPTRCLEELKGGDRTALKRLFPLVYDELRVLANGMMRDERVGHSLQPTALVHEAYLRIVEYDRMDWKSKAHFFAVAAQAIRRVLIDHARKQRSVKRGGGQAASVMIHEPHEPLQATTPPVDLIELNDLLTRLASLHERQARVVEMRFFGGLSPEEVAHVLDVSRTTVCDDWAVARAWLLGELSRGARS